MSQYSDKTIELFITLVERRRDLHHMLGQDYESAIAPYRAVLRGLHKERGGALLPIAISCAKEADAAGEELAPSLFFAAYADEMTDRGRRKAEAGEGR